MQGRRRFSSSGVHVAVLGLVSGREPLVGGGRLELLLPRQAHGACHRTAVLKGVAAAGAAGAELTTSDVLVRLRLGGRVIRKRLVEGGRCVSKSTTESVPTLP